MKDTGRALLSCKNGERVGKNAIRKKFNLSPDEALSPVEHDDEGVPVSPLHELIGNGNAENTSAIGLVRTPFLISLFHFWERQIVIWRKLGEVSYKEKVHAATMEWLGKKPDLAEAKIVRELMLAADCAKHGPGPSCRKLHECRSDLFEEWVGKRVWPNDDPRDDEFKPSDRWLKISDSTMKAFFDAVRVLAPQPRAWPQR